ncbi:hypothetical protein KUL72_29890 [Bradyrhizobium arachidis]|uniref:hypothetical protein n=1 Tax=Bradyrhizobium arachidis TaxID=858423 RepID=UPI00216235E7|nr:hypothetical protein [Bradyrhizobium arachidis]UVO35606.1 hypothetical protein KUL72_29890 [Bradyrhizobium arachidis]
MRLIRLILFDLALILLSSGDAKATNVAAGASSASVRQTAPREVAPSSKHGGPYYGQTPLVAGQPPDNPGRDELADYAGMEPSFACVIRESRRPTSYIFDSTERLNLPPRVMPSVCNPIASPLSLLPAGSGMIIIAFATILLVIVVIVVEIFGPM